MKKHLRLVRQFQLEQLENRQLMVGDIRSFDGTGNNLAHPDWGSTDEQLLRIAPAAYGDRVSAPAGANRLSAREISNLLATHGEENTANDRNLTAYLYIWGQFLDHDLDLTGSASPSEKFNIAVPTGDASFDPLGTGTQVIPLSRSVYDAKSGTNANNPRQQINQITAWIDGSMVYGSDATRAAALRTFQGGLLKSDQTSVGELPGLNSQGLANANDMHRVSGDQLFLAGDVRANENIELTSLQTLFVREHNRIAGQIAAANPSLNDEQIYQRARAQVIGEIEAITYNEWLPSLLGANALPAYRGYNPKVNPGITNEFSTAAFRLHTTINDDVEFFDNNGRPIEFTYVNDQGETVAVDGEIALSDAFFNPTLFKQTGVDGILKYAASTHAEELDNQVVNSLRNFLFGKPGQGGLDLASLNIQRGRDHGLADYNSTRAAMGLPKVKSFADITSDTKVQAELKAAYGNVNDIDLWVGLLAEKHLPGSSVGALTSRILVDQFQRLRDGDRFWYQNVFSGRQLAAIDNTTLADVIERNTDVTGLQDNVFVFRSQVSGRVFADFDADGRLDRNEAGISGATLQLLNDEGEVVATTRSNRDGEYRFDDFGGTGDYSVRLVPGNGQTVTSTNPQSILISSGDVSLRNVNFGVRGRGSAPNGPRSAAAESSVGSSDAIFAAMGAAEATGTPTTKRNRR